MSCLVCRYFNPTEPPEHKEARLAGACEHHCGNRWNQYTAIRYYINHKQHLKGWCHAHPKAQECTSGYVCAEISVAEFFHNASWGVPMWKEDDNIWDWCGKVLRALQEGTFDRRENERLNEQVKKLRAQLKASQKMSASRLKRLLKQKQPAPPEVEEEPQPTAEVIQFGERKAG